MKKLIESVNAMIGFLGIGGIGGAIENETSIVKPIILLAICGIVAMAIMGANKYAEWKKAERKRIRRNIRSRINRANSCEYPSFLC